MSSVFSTVSGSISALTRGSATASASVSDSSLVSPTKASLPPTISSVSVHSTSAAKPPASSGTPSAISLPMSSGGTKPNEAKPTVGMPSESTGKDNQDGVTTTGTPTKPTGSSASTSKPVSTSSRTTPTTSSTSRQNQQTGGGQTTHSPVTSTRVSVIHIDPSTTRTLTSTITDAPLSTFSTPVAVSVTDSANGKVMLSTPEAVTVFSTSTAGDGEFVTYTHVIANPTSYRSDATSSGFLSNHGAVAGVFVSVGVVVITVSVFLAICIRQRRRLSRRRRWLEGMQPQYVPDPFEDPTETREVRSLDGLGPLAGFNDSRLELSRPPTRASQRPSVMRKPVPDYLPEDRDAFDPDRLGYMNVQRAVNRDSVLMSRASIAPSTPSIYPASLPDDDNSDGQDATTGHHSDSQASTHYLVPPPPRPPRSHLRLSSVRPGQIYPTPATSFSAASPEQPSSPDSENGYWKGGKHPILARRTLLGVQPRLSPDLDQ